jgi:hypothetical protein
MLSHLEQEALRRIAAGETAGMHRTLIEVFVETGLVRLVDGTPALTPRARWYLNSIDSLPKGGPLPSPFSAGPRGRA